MTPRQRLAEGVRERARALSRFAEWEAAHPVRLSPSAAVEAIGALYQLLPPPSRSRAVDPSGIIALHEILKRLAR
jgi:hypothetical protein